MTTALSIPPTVIMSKQHTNENTKPRNNLVAQSDLQGALKGIEASFEEYKDKQETDENDSGSVVTLLQQAQASLTRHVERLVEPMHDDDYHEYLKRNVVQDEDDTEDESENESDDEESLQDDDDELFNEEELLDQEVLQRARVLRQKVREASERVGKLRASVTDRAVSVAQREANLLVGPKPKPMKPFDARASAQQLEHAPPAIEKSAKLVEMEQSLQSLTSSLQEMQNNVPDTMETLQETIDTIQTAMQQEGESLSQTERAIRSRTNEGPLSQETTVYVEPAARLGAFLGLH